MLCVQTAKALSFQHNSESSTHLITQLKVAVFCVQTVKAESVHSDCPGFQFSARLREQHTRYYALESTCTLCSVSRGTEFPCTPESSTHVVMHLKVPVLCVRIVEELSFLHTPGRSPPFFSLSDCICTVYLFIVVCSPQKAAHTVFHRFPIYCVFRLPKQ